MLARRRPFALPVIASVFASALAFAMMVGVATSGPASARSANDAAGDDAAIASAAVTRLAYPQTRRLDLVEDHFGIQIADPYRWLEGDLRGDPAVRDWVAAENRVTTDYLAGLPGRDTLRGRMAALYAHGRYGVPRKAGHRYFYGYNSGLQNQTPLYVCDGLAGPQRLLIDPNGWQGGVRALAEWQPSPDGRLLAYAVQDAGSDWRTLRVLDVDSGRTLDDQVAWVRFSDIAWGSGGQSFFYSRFPADQPGAGQQLWYHRIGTAQAADRLIYETPDDPALVHRASVTDDGRWLLIRSSRGTEQRHELHVADLAGMGQGGDIEPRLLVRGLRDQWRLIGSRGSILYFVTDRGAPQLRVVTLDAARPRARLRQVVAPRADLLAGGSLVGNRLILAYVSDSATIAELVELDGRKVGDVPLPGVGTAAGFGGRGGDPETFFSFSGFTLPATIYRLDTATGRIAPFAQPDFAFRPEDFQVDQVRYPSKDGTMIPMYVIRSKALALSGKPAPTILYGYGGFNIALMPGFSPTRLAWIEQGGVYAIANLRGGGEFGKAWHDAGRLANKQNVFDDFIAAAEYLKSSGITGADQLAIEGRSNGGLLVGAVVNQRPDLFAAALPSVGVMDMLRFDRFTAGRYWIDDYGSPDKEEDFLTLLRYSPYHNIAAGRDYPAILVSTADSDDRVVPAHSFKYAAALQAADLGTRPHLIRIAGQSGHGGGKPIDKLIDEVADSYAFAAHFTGLQIGDANR